MANGIINGNEYYVNIAGKYIIGGITANLSFKTATKDLTCRETYNWKLICPSWRSWSVDFEGKFMFDFLDSSMLASQKPSTFVLEKAFFAQGSTYSRDVWLEFYSINTGNICWYGYGYLKSASIDTPNEDSSTVKLSLIGKGAPTMYQVT